MNINQKTRVWLAARFLIFPLAVLLPFFFIRLGEATCYTDGANVGLRVPQEPAIYGFIALGLMTAFLVLSFVRTDPRHYLKQREHAVKQALVSLASIVFTVPTYLLMHSYSQLNQWPNWWCDADGQLHGTRIDTTFGIGLSPSTVVVMAVIYLLLPLALLYITRFSKKHVGGVKKNDLFQ